MENREYDILKEYRTLRNHVFFPFDDKMVENFPDDEASILAMRTRLEEVKEKLDDIKIKTLKQVKTNLLSSIKKALELTTNNRLGYPLSRNQGLGISNYIYGKVAGIMKSAMDSITGYGWGQIYLDKNGDFDSTNLIGLLNEFHDELEKKNFSSYLELEDFYEQYYNNIMELWKKEEREHPQREY